MAPRVARRHCEAGDKELGTRAGRLAYGSVAVASSRCTRKGEKGQNLCPAGDQFESQLHK